MKKVLLIGLVFLLVIGCGNSTKELNIDEATTVIEKTIKNATSIEKDTLENVYDLDFSNISSYVAKQNNDGDLFIIIKATDKVKVKNNMEEYFRKVKDFNASYTPERLTILENRVEKELGDYLIYIVAEKADTIYNEILGTLE